MEDPVRAQQAALLVHLGDVGAHRDALVGGQHLSPVEPFVALAGADMETLAYELVQQGLAGAGPNEDSLHQKIVNRVERETIAQVMLDCNNVQTKAAAKLGINRNTLHKKLKEYELDL